ncbi:MAG: 2-isopropylmalate synthase [Candidatus Peregrinibacteria bacterium Greene0416_19]|nr:MAG: 2-isopropylmalate synthase [Candidatus Peregrinibacteria bacterium Greene0416_19]
MNGTREIFFNDVTLRDGEQAPGNKMKPDEKIRIAKQLVTLGINGIEAGFPAASPNEFRSVAAIAEQVGPMRLDRAFGSSPHPRISGLAHLKRDAIAAVLKAVRPAPHRGIHTFISTSSAQMVKFERMIRQRGGDPDSLHDFIDRVVLPDIEEEFAYIRSKDPDTVIQFSLEDWTRTDETASYHVILHAVRNGASIINLPDTVGIGIPRLIHEQVRRVRRWLDENGFGHVRISWHGHNDTGQGVASAMEALYAGAEQFETTILGIGERAGNYAFEGMLAAIDANMGIHERFVGRPIRDTLVRSEVMRTAKLVSGTIGAPIPREHPIVGENAFAHESGIHQDGVEKGRKKGRRDVYEILDPTRYGAVSKLILGKHSGWSGMKAFLEERQLVFRHSDGKRFSAALSRAADNRRKGLSDEEVLRNAYYPTVVDITGGPLVTGITVKRSPDPLKTVIITCNDGSTIESTATDVREGAVNALVVGLERLMPGVDVRDFDVHNKPGEESSAATAVGTVTIRNGHELTMQAEALDTEQAGLQAVIRAFNALWAYERYAAMSHDEDASQAAGA